MKGTLFTIRATRVSWGATSRIIEPNPNSKDESNPSGADRREKKIMMQTNDENKTEQSSPAGHSRRDFIVSAATAVAGVGAANLLNLQPAQGANAISSAADWSPRAHEVRTSRSRS